MLFIFQEYPDSGQFSPTLSPDGTSDEYLPSCEDELSSSSTDTVSSTTIQLESPSNVMNQSQPAKPLQSPSNSIVLPTNDTQCEMPQQQLGDVPQPPSNIMNPPQYRESPELPFNLTNNTQYEAPQQQLCNVAEGTSKSTTRNRLLLFL